MQEITVVYDACVLYPAPLRDLLVHLAILDLFHAKWTDTIHEEWISGVLKDRADLSRENLERTRRLMNTHVRDCLVTGYEPIIPSLTLPDPDDRHVLAAAIHCGADVILTFNLKDFPASILQLHGIIAQHPDDFIAQRLRESPDTVCAAARLQRASLKNPPKSVDEYLASLVRQRLPATVAGLRRLEERI